MQHSAKVTNSFEKEIDSASLHYDMQQQVDIHSPQNEIIVESENESLLKKIENETSEEVTTKSKFYKYLDKSTFFVSHLNSFLDFFWNIVSTALKPFSFGGPLYSALPHIFTGVAILAQALETIHEAFNKSDDTPTRTLLTLLGLALIGLITSTYFASAALIPFILIGATCVSILRSTWNICRSIYFAGKDTIKIHQQEPAFYDKLEACANLYNVDARKIIYCARKNINPIQQINQEHEDYSHKLDLFNDVKSQDQKLTDSYNTRRDNYRKIAVGLYGITLGLVAIAGFTLLINPATAPIGTGILLVMSIHAMLEFKWSKLGVFQSWLDYSFRKRPHCRIKAIPKNIENNNKLKIKKMDRIKHPEILQPSSPIPMHQATQLNKHFPKITPQSKRERIKRKLTGTIKKIKHVGFFSNESSGASRTYPSIVHRTVNRPIRY